MTGCGSQVDDRSGALMAFPCVCHRWHLLQEVQLPDVERGGHCFTDGCGSISSELLQAAVARVPFAPKDNQDVTAIQVTQTSTLTSCPLFWISCQLDRRHGSGLHSAPCDLSWCGGHTNKFCSVSEAAATCGGRCWPPCLLCVAAARPGGHQVRYGGAKGVLALDPRLPGRQLRVRPSMRKFGSTHRQLEVISVAQRIPCYLNRWAGRYWHTDMPVRWLPLTALQALLETFESETDGLTAG